MIQKRRSRDRRSEAYKKRRKPGAMGLLAKAAKSIQPKPKKKLLTLEKKTAAISMLALKEGSLRFGPAGFTDLMKSRTGPAREIVESTYPTVPERKAGFLHAVGGKDTVNRWRLEMNQWLEGIGRPELKLSLEEALELVLGVIH